VNSYTETRTAQDAVEAALERLRSAGYKATPQRREILRAIARLRHPDFGEVRRSCPRAGLVTVYRTLDLLVGLGVVRRLNPGGGKDRYELCDRNHDHFICEDCSKVFNLDGALPERRRVSPAGADFEAEVARVEVYGRCPSPREECELVTPE
jgi:Fe2+ or Zn2+ uptake regulation protein